MSTMTMLTTTTENTPFIMGKGSYGEPDWANPDNTTAAPIQDVGVTGSAKQNKLSR